MAPKRRAATASAPLSVTPSTELDQPSTVTSPTEVEHGSASGFVTLGKDQVDTGYTVVTREGGTWNCGSSAMHCWSHYKQPTRRHHATAIMAFGWALQRMRWSQ